MGPYPTSVGEVKPWAETHSVPLAHARDRFIQHVVLDAIADSNWAELLVFKGGNALRFAYSNERTTIDLDFTAVGAFRDETEWIRENLNEIVESAGRRHGVALKVQRCRRNPPGLDKTMPTYDLKIGYAFPEDRGFESFHTSTALPSSAAIVVEISINDVVCETTNYQVSSKTTGMLRVCSIEDIVAEKLRALLQQVTRNRSRPQDVLDIAVCCRDQSRSLDVRKIRSFLLAKAAARNIEPRESSFNQEVETRARADYADLQASAGEQWVPFDEAWREVLDLVARLELPK